MKVIEEVSSQKPESVSELPPDFSSSDKASLEKYLTDGIQAGISLELSMKWFALYMSGYSYADIQKTFTQYKLEAILYAAYKYKWHDTKIDQVQAAQNRVAERLLQARIDMVDLLLDKMKATEVHDKEALKKYIADPTVEAPNGAIMTLRQMKEAVDIIEKLSMLGQPIQHQINLNTTSTTKVVLEDPKNILDKLSKFKEDDISD